MDNIKTINNLKKYKECKKKNTEPFTNNKFKFIVVKLKF